MLLFWWVTSCLLVLNSAELLRGAPADIEVLCICSDGLRTAGAGQSRNSVDLLEVNRDCSETSALLVWWRRNAADSIWWNLAVSGNKTWYVSRDVGTFKPKHDVTHVMLDVTEHYQLSDYSSWSSCISVVPHLAEKGPNAGCRQTGNQTSTCSHLLSTPRPVWLSLWSGSSNTWEWLVRVWTTERREAGRLSLTRRPVKATRHVCPQDWSLSVVKSNSL